MKTKEALMKKYLVLEDFDSSQIEGIELMLTDALADQQGNSGEQLYRFVKASERLPEDSFQNVIVRHIRTGGVGLGKTMGHDSLMSVDFVGWNSNRGVCEFKDVEWLEPLAGLRHKDQCPEINHDPVVVNEIEPDFDAMRVQQAKERIYWQKRCEAAEAFINIGMNEDTDGLYQRWQALKSSPNQSK